MDNDKLQPLLGQMIEQTYDWPRANRVSGKVRESYIFENGVRAIIVTDRISVFDYPIGAIPLKGAILNRINNLWIAEIENLGIPTHFLKAPHPNVSLNLETEALPIEIVVRAYLTGSTTTSAWYAYNHHDRWISGVQMPEGMRRNERFNTPIITPSTKAISGHDRNISPAEIISSGLVSEALYAEAEALAQRMFVYGQKRSEQLGLILADTKYEMGVGPDGRLRVIDEIHTPDSSRYWLLEGCTDRIERGEEPESLDKEFVRRMIIDAGYDVDGSAPPGSLMTDSMRLSATRRYLNLFERVTGETAKLESLVGQSIENALNEAAEMVRPM